MTKKMGGAMNVTSKDGKVRVELENIGEGICGDYQGPENDVPLMRMSVYHRVDGVYEECDDASYCPDTSRCI